MHNAFQCFWLALFLVVLPSCGKHDAADSATVIPPGMARPLSEAMEQVKHLRVWVTDPFPPGTAILNYRRADAWDGTLQEFWILICPGDFASLKQSTASRSAFQGASGAPYKILEIDLQRLGVTLGGKRPPEVWNLDWKTTAKNTNVRGHIYPHAGGELLWIERITVK